MIIISYSIQKNIGIRVVQGVRRETKEKKKNKITLSLGEQLAMICLYADTFEAFIELC